ncbi:uncharacterized protein Bfra_007663 [Botrytis fragariae]|uniref:Uncharacterized protein n=1 Tax=Botrytis fragariae TaxID=1964551 RepID=A0A8H6APB0_9HELO|nr:uncharacterized protein Bfra_007663 [Botrytis fragariae]KAF5871149.1 hypothetical protein Bfra_007663 [Botrytis fragariae]
MSNILNIGNGEYNERQPEGESSQFQNELAEDSQQGCPSIKKDDTESGFIFRDEKPLSALISEGETLNLAETPGSTGSMEVTFDCEYDLEAYLEDFSRLTRKGKFDAAKDLFESCPSDLRDHPEFVLDFVDTLLKQGAYKTLVNFAADKESTLLKQLSDCGQIPSQYLLSVFELGRRRAFGYLPDSEAKDVGADKVQLELLAKFENLDSIQVQLLCNIIQLDSEPVKYIKLPMNVPQGTKSMTDSSLNWHSLYKHLLSTNRIWDMRDLLQALCSRYGVGGAIKLFLKNRQQAASKRVLESDELEFSEWFHFMFDWTHSSHGDESTDLALLEMLVTISLQLLSHSSQNDPSITKIINQAMAHANQFAISLSLSNPDNVQTNPYLKWALANQRLARQLPSNPRQIPDYKYIKQSQGVIIWTSNLPIYVPLDPHDLTPMQWKRQSRSTPENLLKLGLEISHKNGDYSLVVQYLQEIFYTSETPIEVLTELSRIQKDLQGDSIGYLQTCLTKYLCVSDETAMENLSIEIKNFDENTKQLDFTRIIDPLTRWCQRGIQAALYKRLHGNKPLENPYLEKQDNAYRELPHDFKRLLAEVVKGLGAYRLNSADEALPNTSTEPCEGTIYRDDNFIVCDSSGYFTRMFEEPSHEEVLIEM